MSNNILKLQMRSYVMAVHKVTQETIKGQLIYTDPPLPKHSTDPLQMLSSYCPDIKSFEIIDGSTFHHLSTIDYSLHLDPDYSGEEKHG